jgi:hypothetical protein
MSGHYPAGADSSSAPWNREDCYCEVDSVDIDDENNICLSLSWEGVDDFLLGTETYPTELIISAEELLELKGI